MLGNPNLTIGAATFNSIDGNGGAYVASSRQYPYSNHIYVRSEVLKDLRRRTLVDRRLGMAKSVSDPTEQTLSVKLVMDIPNNTTITNTLLRGEIDILNTLLSATNLAAILRGET